MAFNKKMLYQKAIKTVSREKININGRLKYGIDIRIIRQINCNNFDEDVQNSLGNKGNACTM
jgi:hypothetical protein